MQKSGKQTYRLEGSEIRFGRSRLIAGGGTLPAGMAADSQKMLITGAPARAVSVPTEAGQSSSLAGRRILFDRDSRMIWIRGDEKFPAQGEQKKNRMTAAEIQFSQKTDTRGEKIVGRGPGRLEMNTRRTDAQGTHTGTAAVSFAGDVTYSSEEHQARFTGGVKLVDGTTTSRSQTLTVEFSEDAAADRMEIKQIVAAGDVVVTGEKRSASGEKLIYDYPSTGPDVLVATLTAKPGKMCEMRASELLARSARIDMVETRTGEGRTAIRAKSEGRGALFHQPKPDPGDTKPRREGFEVHYEQSGSYDEAARKAVFEGNVRVKRGDMDLDARHVVMDFTKEKSEGTEEREAAERLKLVGITATDDVRYASGPADNRIQATGEKLVWDRRKDTAEIRGGTGPKDFARVVRDESELEAPVILAFLKDGKLDRAVATGGGHMTGRTRSRKGTDKGKPREFDVTWTGEGVYETLEPGSGTGVPTAMIRVEGSVRAVSGDADVSADLVRVYLGPESETPGAGTLRQEVRSAVATGNARAKMFMPEGNYYRHAKGDSLEWDRLERRMVVMSKTGDAVVWDNSNEWTGRRLVVNRTAEGRIEAESTSGRRIVFYDEGMPPSPSKDAREWKPIY
ncbi:MAG: hypothetical protein AMS16_00115 [Planctomycetes bacterium DG_58]|nr:MAG: hypothetical protein AMS16_00115 [Planctomycetes bacterium DG_58]